MALGMADGRSGMFTATMRWIGRLCAWLTLPLCLVILRDLWEQGRYQAAAVLALFLAVAVGGWSYELVRWWGRVEVSEAHPRTSPIPKPERSRVVLWLLGPVLAISATAVPVVLEQLRLGIRSIVSVMSMLLLLTLVGAAYGLASLELRRKSPS